MNYEEFAKAINELPANTNLDLKAENLHIERISFDSKGGGEFGWIACRNYSVCRNVGYIHPMANANYVKTFKTLAGAKRNAIKYFDFIFKNNQ